MSVNLNKYYNSRTRIFWHIVFWGCFLAAHTLFYGSPDNTYFEEFMWALRYLPFKMAVTYFTLYFIIPRYLLTKKYVKAILVLLASMVLAVFIQQIANYAIIFPLLYQGWEGGSFYSSKMFRIFLGIYPVVTIAAFIKLAKYWYEKENQAQELKQQKLEAELRFLKAQTHPHFLFNTLNNLYALTLKKSEVASEVVLKLSELLNYVLYECNEQTVPLERELDLVESYISLERIRYGNRLNVSFNVAGKTGGKQIPPMLILPFVENSFKHGVSRQLEQVWVHIEIRVEGDEFSLRVENSSAPEAEGEYEQNCREGIGLANVRRRLDLLYGEGYQLDILEEADRFRIALALNLNHPLKPEAA